MRESMQFIREFTVWLHHPLFEYGLFYIDLWSLVHFWSGMILFTGLSARGWEKRWNWLIFFLVAFEVVEATIFISIMKMFQPEKLPDCFTDVFIGLAGGYLVYLLFEKWKLKIHYSKLFLFWLAAGTVSFLWTGNSGYLFNNQMLNTPGINWWIFLCWMAVGMAVLYIYYKMRISNYNTFKSFALTWVAYLLPMLILINITSNQLFAGEVTQVNSSYLSRVLPGDTTKIFFYLSSPFFFLGVFRLLDALFRIYFLNYNIYTNE